MIAMLTGRAAECRPDLVVIDVAGVGYRVEVPLTTYYRLKDLAGQGDVQLQIHTHVREDCINLYGFATHSERSLFELLLGVAGVGPRVALAALSGMSADDLVHAIRTGNVAQLRRIPGIGQKTAERMVVDLKDRVDRLGAVPAEPSVPAAAPSRGATSEAVSALLNLGYRQREAEAAIRKASKELGDSGTVEDLLRAALAALSRG